MGGGTYSSASYLKSDGSTGYKRSNDDKTVYFANAGRDEIFSQKSINNAMNPHGIKIRESRDSAEHPTSLAIVLALDVTGSMGSIPHHLVKEGLPDIMGNIIQRGVKHPQVLFVGIGDHEVDDSPLQVGQFESSDDLLDKWLTDLWLEGGGGGNAGESYLLAWYFALQHTAIDCLEIRGQKGILFTIGDEPTLKHLPKSAIKGIMGDGQYEDYSAAALLDKVREKYHVYHVHCRETYSGSRREVIDGWRELLGDHLLIAEKYQDVSKIISETIQKHNASKSTSNSSKEDMML